MGKGLRIHHTTERNVVLLVPIPAKTPELGGTPKDIYIHLDENGDAIVSEGVWGELGRAFQCGLSDHQFVILNEVLDPPTLVVGQNESVSKVKARMKRAMVQTPDGARDAQLQAVAQKFAPKGVKVRITSIEAGHDFN